MMSNKNYVSEIVSNYFLKGWTLVLLNKLLLLKMSDQREWRTNQNSITSVFSSSSLPLCQTSWDPSFFQRSKEMTCYIYKQTKK